MSFEELLNYMGYDSSGHPTVQAVEGCYHCSTTAGRQGCVIHRVEYVEYTNAEARVLESVYRTVAEIYQVTQDQTENSDDRIEKIRDLALSAQVMLLGHDPTRSKT